jgi:Fe-S-cluster containining protein
LAYFMRYAIRLGLSISDRLTRLLRWILELELETELNTNPCLTCGACCALYKVTFPSAEVDDHQGGGVPCGLTERVNNTRSAMKGTTGFSKRCAALEGTIGKCVSCAIYQHRPSTCGAFLPAWDEHCRNGTCNRARITFGMQPFETF